MYPSGIKLIERGECPKGAVSPMSGILCMSGHLLECHWPVSCEEANCSHLKQYDRSVS